MSETSVNPRSLQLEVVRSAESFAALRVEWNRLLESSAARCVFLSWEWLYTWWKYFGGGQKLLILTVRRDEALIAALPLFLDARWPGRWLGVRRAELLATGSVGSDYLDAIVSGECEQECLDLFRSFLARGRMAIRLAQLGPRPFVERLAAGLEFQNWGRLERSVNIAPFIRLAGHSWESYLASLGSEHRYNFRRRLKALNKRGYRFERIESEEARSPAFQTLIRLHNLRWSGRGGSDAFDAPQLIHFHEEWTQIALARDWLRLFVLVIEGEPAAAFYGIRYGPVFYFYQAGFDPRYAKQSVGLVTMGLAIRSAIEEGAEEFDLLHGDEAYKRHWAHENRAIREIEAYPPGIAGRLCESASRVRRASGKMARRLLPPMIADTMPAAWHRALAKGTHAPSIAD